MHLCSLSLVILYTVPIFVGPRGELNSGPKSREFRGLSPLPFLVLDYAHGARTWVHLNDFGSLLALVGMLDKHEYSASRHGVIQLSERGGRRSE